MINIEKIDAVIAATGADYATVRQALLAANGDVAQAIRSIMNDMHYGSAKQQKQGSASYTYQQPEEQEEDATNGSTSSQKSKQNKQRFEEQIDDVVQVIKEIWKTGNASSLIVEKDGKVILNLSLTVSAFIVILTPLISLIGLGTALLSEYTIKIVMNNGEVIDVLAYSFRRGASRSHYEDKQDPTEAPTTANEDQTDDTETHSES